MFERFTDRARRVVVLAQEEARMLNHNYIGTEHILLGLIHEGEGVAAKSLESLGISLEGVRSQVEEIIGQGQQAPSGHIPFTPRAKKVLELSLREALQLGHNYIGTEHILLGLISTQSSDCATVSRVIRFADGELCAPLFGKRSGFAARYVFNRGTEKSTRVACPLQWTQGAASSSAHVADPREEEQVTTDVRKIHRPCPSGRRPGPRRGQDAQPQLHRHRAHPAGSHPRR